MSDLRQLSPAAAAAPTSPADVEAMLRAAARRRRRWVTWLASLGAVIAVGTPMGLQWAADGGHRQVGTLPVPGRTTTTTVAGQPTVTSPKVVPGFFPPSNAVPKAGRSEVPNTVATASSSRAAAEPSKQTTDSAPTASDCLIDTRGMAAGTTKSCRFTATGAGGWWAGFAGTPVAGYNSPDPSAVVSVTRAGSTLNYRTGGNPGGPGMDMSSMGCGDEIIQLGDLVEVDVTAGNGQNPGAYYEAGAGVGWNCAGHP